ncbi:MAG: AAA domain-containing protein [Hydrogenophaga sp.]
MLCQNYNSSQLWAIYYACIQSNEHQDTDIKLLQGPPGTGKTRTTIGIISALLCQQVPFFPISHTLHCIALTPPAFTGSQYVRPSWPLLPAPVPPPR